MENYAIMYFDNDKIKEKIEDNLGNIREFNQEEFFDPTIRNYLIKKLELQDNYWTQFRNSVWNYLKENGFVVVKNLPFDKNNRLSVGLASTIGTPIRHNSKVPETVREITPRSDPMPLENLPHTDSPHFPQPNDLITLQCAREDQKIKVYSRIVPIWLVLNELKHDEKNIVIKFSDKKYPFILTPDFGDAGYHMQPILTKEVYAGKTHDHVRFCRSDTIDCVKNFNVHIDDMDDLIYFESIATKIGEANQFLFKEGDFVIFDNKRNFHSKTKTSENTVRVLKKMKLKIDRNKVFGS